MKILCLAVDIQDKFIEKFNNDGQEVSFPGAARGFADQLRAIGIPTLWVAYGDTGCAPHYYSQQELAQISDDQRDELQGKLRLTCPIRDGEDIFLKGQNDAFHGGLLTRVLKEQQVDVVLLVGLNTGGCIAETLEHGTKDGIRFIVVSDLLAQVEGGARHGNMEWHLNKLAVNLNKIGGRRIEFESMSHIEALMKFSPDVPVSNPLCTHFFGARPALAC